MRKASTATALMVGVLAFATVGLGAGVAAAAKQPAVKVTLTDEGCPKRVKAKSGRITFTVTNDNATKVSEFEVLRDDKILGEIENVAPGLTRSFSVTLEPGKYDTYCPGGDRDYAVLLVSDSAAKATTATTSATTSP